MQFVQKCAEYCNMLIFSTRIVEMKALELVLVGTTCKHSLLRTCSEPQACAASRCRNSYQTHTLNKSRLSTRQSYGARSTYSEKEIRRLRREKYPCGCRWKNPKYVNSKFMGTVVAKSSSLRNAYRCWGPYPFKNLLSRTVAILTSSSSSSCTCHYNSQIIN